MKIKKSILGIYILSAAIYATQGIESLPALPLFIFLKEKLHFTPSQIMYLSSLTGIAWLVKIFWGYLSDNYFHKKSWIALSVAGSILISCYLGFSSILSIALLTILLIFNGINGAMRDTAVDGLACIEGKETNTCDKIQAIQWTAITIAGIVASLGGGFIAQHFSYKLAYLCLIPFYIVMLFCLNGFKESPRVIGICKECKNFKTCLSQKKQFSDLNYCCFEKTTLWQTIGSYKELFTNKQFLFACLFLFLYKYSPGFGTPLMYIERDTFKWSAQFMGILGAIGSALEIIGAILFFKYCKKINIKKWLIFSVFLGAATTLLYLYFTPVSAIVYGILFSSIGMFVHLIVMAFMAQSTLSGKEATSFALLCSISNLAATASTLSGAFLLPKIGLAPLIIVSALTSFLCLPLISKLNINKGETNVQTY